MEVPWASYQISGRAFFELPFNDIKDVSVSLSVFPLFLRAPLQDILQNEGPGALFRGLESTLWRDVPFSAFYWLGVEAVRDRFLQHGALP